jgi:hypothetical protein
MADSDSEEDVALDVFKAACAAGRFEEAQVAARRLGLSLKYALVVQACGLGGRMSTLEGLRAFLEELPLFEVYDFYVENAIRLAGMFGRRAEVEFMADVCAQRGMLDLLRYAMGSAVCSGRLDIVEFLVHRGVGLSEHSFVSACESGRIAVAQYLLSLGGVDIHGDEDEAMATAVENGDLDTARFLFQLDPRPGAWPVHCMSFIQAWSAPRDAWMRSVVPPP